MIPALTFSKAFLQQIIAKMQRFQPEVVVGYSTYLAVVAEEMLDSGLKDIRPKAVMSGSNALLNSQRHLVEKAFEAPVFDRYGSRELGCIASECRCQSGFHVCAENVYVEFEPLNEAGEENAKLCRLVCTSLGNRGMPFIRYEIGDLGISGEGECQCGRGLPRIQALKGRTHNLLRTPSGKIIPGDAFDLIFWHYADVVRQFQVRQTRLDEMVVRLVLAKEIRASDLEAIEQTIKDIVGPGVAIRLNPCDKIEVSASGKLDLTIFDVES